MVRVFSNNGGGGGGGGSRKQIEAKANNIGFCLLFWKVESEMNVDRCSRKPDTADLEVLLSSASFVHSSFIIHHSR